MRVVRTERQRSWRPLIAVIVAYALAAQAVFLSFGGLAIAAPNDGPAFTLCLHDNNGAPVAPSDKPDQSGYCSHCIFCFADAHHVLPADALTVVRHLYAGRPVDLRTTATRPHVLQPRYSIAKPRGPPLTA